MKIVLRILLLTALAVLNRFNAYAWLSTETVDGITWPYTIENDEAIIGDVSWLGYFYENPPTGDVVIPSTLGGYPVTAIGDNCFFDCSEITSVIIPQGVKSIGSWAFQDCTALTNVEIPSSVKVIGWGGFGYCHSLSNITIPEGVESIDNLAFIGCQALENVTIPSSVTNFGGGVFARCANLKSVSLAESNLEYVIKDGLLLTKDGTTIVSSVTDLFSIPDGVTSIGNYALAGSGLTELTLPQSVTNIGVLAFGLCDNLRSVTIPANVTSIGVVPFADSTNIISFVVAEDNPNYKSLDGHLLSKDGKTFLSGVVVNGNVMIPDGVEKIESSAFEECGSLTGVIIPDSVKEIGDWAFQRCFNLRSVTFGNGVTNIGYSAFGSCRSLETIRIPMSLADMIDVDEVFDTFYAKPEIVYYHGLMEFSDCSNTSGQIAGLRWNEILTYDGYLCDGNAVVGTIQVKRPKYTRSAKWEDKTVVTVQLMGEKKRSFKMWTGWISNTEFDCTTKDELRINLEFGLFGMWGSFENYQVVGARNIFDTKDKSVKSAADNMLAPWLGSLSLISDEGTLSVTVAKKGKVTVKGTFDGAKISVKSQALICETDIRIPVIYSKKGVEMAFVVRLPFSGANPTIEGLDNAVIGKAGELTNGAKFRLDVDDATVAGVIPGALLEYLPNGESVSASGKKWVVAGGAKAAKVKYDKKTGLILVQPAKKGGEVANVANLKLKYTSKDGSFNGSFKIYSVENKKLKTYTFKVSGVLVDGVGYGAATCKKPNVIWNVTVE